MINGFPEKKEQGQCPDPRTPSGTFGNSGGTPGTREEPLGRGGNSWDAGGTPGTRGELLGRGGNSGDAGEGAGNESPIGLFPLLPKATIWIFEKKRDVGVFFWLERVKGIEPSSAAWKAAALPLSYTRVC